MFAGHFYTKRDPYGILSKHVNKIRRGNSRAFKNSISFWRSLLIVYKEYILKTKSNFLLFSTEYIYTRSDFNQIK